jgi:transposase
MARPSALPAEEKVRIVLAVLAGELSLAAAARQAKVSEQSVSNWKRQFLESGRAGLVAGGSGKPSTREQQLEAEVAELTQALGEAHVELRVWKKSAEHRLGPTRASR